MTDVFICFPVIKAVEFNAHAGAYVAGVAQPTSVGGLAHAVARRLCARLAAPMPALTSFLYAVSSFGGFSGISLNQRTTIAAKSEGAKIAKSAPIRDRVRASMDFSLIVQLSVPSAGLLDPLQVQAELENQRLQGASMFVQKLPSVHTDIGAALAELPRSAFVLCDAADHLKTHCEESGQGLLEALGEMISRPADGAYKSRYVPVLVGWRAMTAPATPVGMRENARAHRWTEPLLGLGLFRSKVSAAALLKRDPATTELLWQHAQAGDNYVMRGVSPVSAAPDTEFSAF